MVYRIKKADTEESFYKIHDTWTHAIGEFAVRGWQQPGGSLLFADACERATEVLYIRSFDLDRHVGITQRLQDKSFQILPAVVFNARHAAKVFGDGSDAAAERGLLEGSSTGDIATEGFSRLMLNHTTNLADLFRSLRYICGQYIPLDNYERHVRNALTRTQERIDGRTANLPIHGR